MAYAKRTVGSRLVACSAYVSIVVAYPKAPAKQALDSQLQCIKIAASQTQPHATVMHSQLPFRAEKQSQGSKTCMVQVQNPGFTERWSASRSQAVHQVLGTDMKKHFEILSRFQVSYCPTEDAMLCLQALTCWDPRCALH